MEILPYVEYFVRLFSLRCSIAVELYFWGVLIFREKISYALNRASSLAISHHLQKKLAQPGCMIGMIIGARSPCMMAGSRRCTSSSRERQTWVVVVVVVVVVARDVVHWVRPAKKRLFQHQQKTKRTQRKNNDNENTSATIVQYQQHNHK